MTRLPSSSLGSAVLLALALSTLPFASVQSDTLLEDFSTTTLRDAAATTADWNTDLGVLQLFPFQTTARGSLDTPGLARDIAWQDGIAYVADQSAGVQIIDVSDPDLPVLLGTFDTPRFALGIAVAGDLVFVGDSDGGFLVLDATDLSNPVQIGSYDTTGFATDLAVVEDLVFVGDSNDGVQIMSVANPTTPAPLANYSAPGVVRGVAATQNLMFVAEELAGLQIVDVSDPFNPTLLSTTVTSGTATDVEVRDDIAYVTDTAAGLLVFDVSNPLQVEVLASVSTPGIAEDVAVVGSRALVADRLAGLQVIDVSDPSLATTVAGFDTPGEARGVTGVEDLAFMADETRGMQIVRVAALSDLDVLGTVAGSGLFRLRAEGDVLVTFNNVGSERVIDISDAANPSVLATLGSGGGVDVALRNRRAYLADRLNGLEIYDLSDPANPALLGTETPSGDTRDVALSGNQALLIVDGDPDILQVVDVTDSANPVTVATRALSGSATTVEVSGDRCYVASGSGLEVFDVSDPTNPSVLGSISRLWTPGSIVIVGRIVYISFTENVVSYDFGDPSSPILLDGITLPIPSSLASVYMSGSDDRLFVAGREGGLFLIDTSNPSDLRIERTIPVASDLTYCVTQDDDNVYVGSRRFSGSSAFQGVEVRRRFQTEVQNTEAIGQSLTLNALDRQVVTVAFSQSLPEGITLEITSDGGSTFASTDSFGSVSYRFPEPLGGNDLRWRATHRWSPGTLAALDQLELDWYYASPTILAVEDVPADQGGRVQVRFERSGLETPSEAIYPVVGYNVLRRVGDSPLSKAVPINPSRDLVTADVEAALPMPGVEAWRADGSIFVRDSAVMPPGTWTIVASVFGMGLDEYLVEVTTVADGTPSEFVVAASSPAAGTTFFSPVAIGTSTDDIAPGVPTNLTASITSGDVHLDWDDAPETDFQYHRVYRGLGPDFEVSSATLVGETASSSFVDLEPSDAEPHYRVTTLDHAGNEGPSALVSVEPTTASPPSPLEFALQPPHPNPFNPAASIEFVLPMPVKRLHLAVFDSRGRRVTTLARGPLPAGRHNLTWDGTDDQGRSVASGLYLCRLEAGSYVQTRPMTLLK